MTVPMFGTYYCLFCQRLYYIHPKCYGTHILALQTKLTFKVGKKRTWIIQSKSKEHVYALSTSLNVDLDSFRYKIAVILSLRLSGWFLSPCAVFFVPFCLSPILPLSISLSLPLYLFHSFALSLSSSLALSSDFSPGIFFYSVLTSSLAVSLYRWVSQFCSKHCISTSVRTRTVFHHVLYVCYHVKHSNGAMHFRRRAHTAGNEQH